MNKAKFSALPKDLQLIVRSACQAEYDNVASHYIANDPRALDTLVNKHGVVLRIFPEDILEAGGKAAREVLDGLLSSDNALTKKAAQSFVSAYKLLQTRMAVTDTQFLRAREKYFRLP